MASLPALPNVSPPGCRTKPEEIPDVSGYWDLAASKSMPASLALAGPVQAYVPLNPAHPPSRLANMISQARLDALIVDATGQQILTEELLDVCPDSILVAESDNDRLHGHDVLDKCTPAGPPVMMPLHRLAYIIFTSGTTGQPKGVMVTLGNIQHFLQVVQQRYQISANDRLSQHVEITFDPSVMCMFMAWGAGASLHVVPQHQLMAPASFIRKQQLTVWCSVPSTVVFMERMKMLKPGMFPSLRLTIFGGEMLPAAIAQAWQKAAANSQLDNQYGATETTIASHFEPCNGELNITPSHGTVAIGRPFPGTPRGHCRRGQEFSAARGDR